MISTRKTPKLFTNYTAQFPSEQEMNYILSVKRITGYNSNIIIPNSTRKLNATFDIENQRYIIHLKTISLNIYLTGDAKWHKYIADLLSSVYDEIVVSMQPNNAVFRLENKTDILRKWNNIKEKILSEYQGTEIHRFMHRLSKRFSSENLILDEILQYDFFGMILKPVYWNYGISADIILEKYLRKEGPIEDILVEEHLKLHDINEENEKVRILLNVVLHKHKNINKYEGFYELDQRTGCIREATILIGEIYNTQDRIREFSLKSI